MICQGCKIYTEDIHKHHIVPKVLGGIDEDSNIVNLCESCHGKVHGRNMLNHRKLTKEGLKKAKARGQVLGAYDKNDKNRFIGRTGTKEDCVKAATAKKQYANAKAVNYYKPIFYMLDPDRKLSGRKMAKVLETEGIPTPLGKSSWQNTQVKRIYKRLDSCVEGKL